MGFHAPPPGMGFHGPQGMGFHAPQGMGFPGPQGMGYTGLTPGHMPYLNQSHAYSGYNTGFHQGGFRRMNKGKYTKRKIKKIKNKRSKKHLTT
jgi:hypothetical protein